MANTPDSHDPIPTPGGLYAYEASRQLAAQTPPFHALIMAAMREADSNNAMRLELVFPELWEEMKARYNAPGGILPQESNQI